VTDHGLGVPASDVPHIVEDFSRAAGIGIAYPASTALALNAVDPAYSGDAAASLEIADTLGTAVGTGVVTALFATSIRFDWAGNASLAAPFVVATVVVILALIPASRGRAHRLLHSSVNNRLCRRRRRSRASQFTPGSD
jgi:hypothetical protein